MMAVATTIPTEVYAIVMTGGRGERFWPLSTPLQPKPFIPLLADGTKSLYQVTIERLKNFIPTERIIPVLAQTHLPIAKKQTPELPETNFVVEPEGRDTAACIGLAALSIERQSPEAIIVVVPSDQYIPESLKFCEYLAEAVRFVQRHPDYTITFGIRPTRVETNYGYIEVGKLIDGNIAEVLRFIEKPSIAVATEFLAAGNYYWNGGTFVWYLPTLYELFKKYMPKHWKLLTKLRELMIATTTTTATTTTSTTITSAVDNDEEWIAEFNNIYSQFERISIDYGILEHTDKIAVVLTTELDWDDVGNWNALRRIFDCDSAGNLKLGDSHKIKSLSTTNSIIYTDSYQVATYDVSELVVAVANGKVLVCSRAKASELKKLIGTLGL